MSPLVRLDNPSGVNQNLGAVIAPASLHKSTDPKQPGYYVIQAVQGGGWQTGLRAVYTPVSVMQETSDGKHMVSGILPQDSCVVAATRPVHEGQLLQLAPLNANGPDTLLAIMPEGGAPADFRENSDYRKLANTAHSILLQAHSSMQPFMEDETVQVLRSQSNIAPVRVYSLQDVARMGRALPLLAAAGLMLAAVWLLWGASWAFLGVRQKRKILLGNLAATAAALLLLPVFLWACDVPGALLPAHNISDFTAYRSLFWLLDELGNYSQLASVQAVRGAFTNHAIASVVLVVVGLLALIALIVFERRYLCNSSSD